MKKKYINHTFAAFFFLMALGGLVGYLQEAGSSRDPVTFSLWVGLLGTFLFSANVHFRLSGIEKQLAAADTVSTEPADE